MLERAGAKGWDGEYAGAFGLTNVGLEEKRQESDDEKSRVDCESRGYGSEVGDEDLDVVKSATSLDMALCRSFCAESVIDT